MEKETKKKADLSKNKNALASKKKYLLKPLRNRFTTTVENKKNKVALITGGESRIDKAVALLFAKEGSRYSHCIFKRNHRCKADPKRGQVLQSEMYPDKRWFI